MDKKSEIAVLGLGTMGNALARNLLSKGFFVAGYNRDFQKAKNLNVLQGQHWAAYESIEALIMALERPRKLLLMLPAGKIIDDMLHSLLPLLDKDDIVLDGGNSYFEDTQRRYSMLKEVGIHYFGLGVSGGEEGALKGPSLMPSGEKEVYKLIKPYLEAIAAKEKGQPCCAYIGAGGAGHYVKMVHNGIEYADMQLLAEVYLILKFLLGLTNSQISQVLQTWNKGELRSYLVEISAKIFLEKDNETDNDLIDMIADKAGQKGTGTWTALEALKQGQAASLIDSAVQARFISNMENMRKTFARPIVIQQTIDTSRLIEEVEWVKEAYYLCKSLAYAQGFALMHNASKDYAWNLNLGEIASIFRKGCIIQAELLEELMKTFANNPKSEHLFLAEQWQKTAHNLLPSLRKCVLALVEKGIAAPLFTSSLTYIDQLSAPLLGANLLQAQRDFFGAHTFERVDKEGMMHYEWNK